MDNLDVKSLSRVPTLTSTAATECAAWNFILSTVLLNHKTQLAERMSQLMERKEVVPMMHEEHHALMSHVLHVAVGMRQ